MVSIIGVVTKFCTQIYRDDAGYALSHDLGDEDSCTSMHVLLLLSKSKLLFSGATHVCSA